MNSLDFVYFLVLSFHKATTIVYGIANDEFGNGRFHHHNQLLEGING
jgi:hypothetical protein